MANKTLVIAMALILQMSVNNVAKVEADIHNGIIENSNDDNIYVDAPVESQGSIEATEFKDLVFEEEYLPTTTSSEDVVANIEPSLYKREKVIDPRKPMIALTFDDGPSKYTQELLDVLNENDAAATFFVLGMQVDKYKETICRMVEEGHQIGNHSYDHKRLTALNDEELYNEINRTDNTVYETALYKPFLVRPPYGATSEKLLEKLQKPIIKWSIDSRDWESRNAEEISKIILDNAKDGDIVLMHDLYESTIEASKAIIPELIKRGFQLVTVGEMSECKNIMLTAGQSYYHMHK
jgi:peptidoglycan/xylan/chitin deacetylase (PgdA/CDA1 family)